MGAGTIFCSLRNGGKAGPALAAAPRGLLVEMGVELGPRGARHAPESRKDELRCVWDYVVTTHPPGRPARGYSPSISTVRESVGNLLDAGHAAYRAGPLQRLRGVLAVEPSGGR